MDEELQRAAAMAAQQQLEARPEGPAKVTLQFVAVGNAPLMKRTKFTVNGHDQLSVVYKFLKKQLRLKDTDALVRSVSVYPDVIAVQITDTGVYVQFVYCNSSFAPSPDQKLSSLYECFQVGDVLILNYSLTQAWG
ncbi:hypothetical protein Gpo141_00008444 [Globisporangium polare]